MCNLTKRGDKYGLLIDLRQVSKWLEYLAADEEVQEQV